MNSQIASKSPVSAKQSWTAPAIKIIDLSAAQHKASTGNDGNGGHTGS